MANRDKFDPNLMGDKTLLCPSCGWPMMTVLDEYERKHHVCQRFSCGYEEMEVKKRVEVAPAEVTPTHASASPVKRVIATASPSSSGKKTIVIHKSAVKAAVAKATPQVKWETVIEVVKPSHYRPKTNYNANRYEKKTVLNNDRPRNDRPRFDNKPRTDRRDSFSGLSSYESKGSSGGGTFADFIKASEERKKRDEEKRKNRK